MKRESVILIRMWPSDKAVIQTRCFNWQRPQTREGSLVIHQNTQLIHGNCSCFNNHSFKWLYHRLLHFLPSVLPFFCQTQHTVDAPKAFVCNFRAGFYQEFHQESAPLAAHVPINTWKLFAKTFPDEKWAKGYTKQYSPREALHPAILTRAEESRRVAKVTEDLSIYTHPTPPPPPSPGPVLLSVWARYFISLTPRGSGQSSFID